MQQQSENDYNPYHPWKLSLRGGGGDPQIHELFWSALLTKKVVLSH